MHTGEKPYVCNISQKAFAQKNKLNSYLKVETGEKPYMCEVCQKPFSYNSSLTIHVILHTGKEVICV